MGLNVSHTMNSSQFENRENLRNAAKKILNKQTSSEDVMKKILDKTFSVTYTTKAQITAQDDILRASVQATMSESLKETMKYLKSQANKKIIKTPIFGELYKTYSEKEFEDVETSEFEFDFSAKNIFVAA